MSARVFGSLLAAGIWVLPVMVLACGNKDDGDTDGPPEDELERLDLGTPALADTGDFTGDLEIEVPEGALSAAFHCGDFGDDVLGAIWYITDPSGNVVFDRDSPDPKKYRSDFLDDMSTGLLPITPNLKLSAGTWKVNWWIGKGNPGSVDCEAVVRVDERSDKAPIVVDLVFVGLDGLNAASAPDDENFQAALAQFEAEWATGGLEPQYNYIDFQGDVSRFAVVDVSDDDYSEFNDLLRKSNPANPRTITFFLVEEIANASAGGATILGLSAGPPGAAATHGTSKSGVIVSAVDYSTAPQDVGKIMAHEGGHFLGLFHTTERGGSTHDPIGDTPECPPSNDTDGNGVMNTAECQGKGAENVMWWTLTSGTASFSADQGWVLRGNPVAD